MKTRTQSFKSRVECGVLIFVNGDKIKYFVFQNIISANMCCKIITLSRERNLSVTFPWNLIHDTDGLKAKIF